MSRRTNDIQIYDEEDNQVNNIDYNISKHNKQNNKEKENICNTTANNKHTNWNNDNNIKPEKQKTTTTTTTSTNNSNNNSKKPVEIICLDDSDDDGLSYKNKTVKKENYNNSHLKSPLKNNNNKQITTANNTVNKPTTPTPIKKTVQKTIVRPTKTKQRSEFLANIHEKRLNIGNAGIQMNENYEIIDSPPQPQKQKTTTTTTTTTTATNNNRNQQQGFDYQSSLNIRKQLESIRNSKHKDYRNDKLGTKKFFDLNDIQQLQKKDKENKMISASMETTIPRSNNKIGGIHTIGNTHPEAIGRKALELTNVFRKQQNLPALIWNQAIYLIGVEHSKNMGDKKVAFGHDGFSERVKKYPFASKSSGENVAYTNSDSDVAEQVVNGWINSPGHRKNMVGRFNVCAIGVCLSKEGFWFLTQLFGYQ